MAEPRYLFVLGSPRSGTTLIGSFLGSSTTVVDLQEYFGFYHALSKTPKNYRRVPTWTKDIYQRSVLDNARRLGLELAADREGDWALDSTPWNLEHVTTLQKVLPDALAVLCLRSPAGVCQSLESSYADGYEWAGADLRARLEIWRSLYRNALDLDSWPVIALNYERLCQDPAAVLARFGEALEAAGVHGPFEKSRFASSHAAGTTAGRPLAELVEHGVRWNPRAPHDPGRWTGAHEELAREMCEDIVAGLAERYPGAYGTPGVHSHRVHGDR